MIMRRWVRFDAPAMVCVDIDEDGYTGKIVNVVLATETDDISLARDFQGHFLVYDEHMNRIPSDNDGSETGTRAVTIADHRGEWPHADDWEQGPDLYDIDVEHQDEDDDEDLEPFDEEEDRDHAR